MNLPPLSGEGVLEKKYLKSWKEVAGRRGRLSKKKERILVQEGRVKE